MRSITVFLCIFTCMLSGCIFDEEPASVVATVNGRPITLQNLEALQESDMSGMGIFEQFSLHELRKQYGKTLGNLLVFELMLQDLEERGLAITSERVQAYEDDIREDYPPGEFEKYFEENALDLEAWRAVLRYNLALQTFTEQVLRKDFVPSLDVVEKYYAAHKDRFQLEESYDLYAVSAAEKKTLQDIKRTEDMLSRIEELQPTEMSLNKSAVPKEWQKMVYALKDTSCTPVFKDAEQYSVFCLKDHRPARVLSAQEAYVYIEEFLAEEELIFSFENWLKEKILTTDIRISKHMLQDVH